MAGGLRSALGITPEERAAMAAGVDVPAPKPSADYLSEPEGAELHWDGIRAQVKPQQAGSLPAASLVSSHPDNVQGMRSTSPSDKVRPSDPIKSPPVRQLTPDELMAKAQEMLAAHKVQAEAQIDAGPSIGDRDDAGSLLPAWLKGAAGR